MRILRSQANISTKVYFLVNKRNEKSDCDGILFSTHCAGAMLDSEIIHRGGLDDFSQCCHVLHAEDCLLDRCNQAGNPCHSERTALSDLCNQPVVHEFEGRDCWV